MMMANKHKGELAFEAGGKTYVLQYSHRALIFLEDKLDKSLMQIVNEMQDWSKNPEGMRLKTIAIMLWAGLQKHHPEMTEDDAVDLMGEIDKGILGVIEIVGEGFARAFSAPGTKGTNPLQRELNGTGTPSGSSTSATATTPSSSGPSLPESGSSR